MWTGHVEVFWDFCSQNSLAFLERLVPFNICKKMMETFYQTVVASALFYAVWWESSIKKSDADKLVSKAGSIVSWTARHLALSRVLSVMENPHPHYIYSVYHTTYLHCRIMLFLLYQYLNFLRGIYQVSIYRCGCICSKRFLTTTIRILIRISVIKISIPNTFSSNKNQIKKYKQILCHTHTWMGVGLTKPTR